MKKTPHQFLSDILKEYYPVICPEFGIHYYGLNENIRLYDKIKNKYSCPEYDLFRAVVSRLQDVFIMSDFYIIEDKAPSLTLVIKNIEGYDEGTDIYFSISLLADCYCFFIKTKDYYGDTLYFAPKFDYAHLFSKVEEHLTELLRGYYNLPHSWLAFKIKYIVPGISKTSKENGQLIKKASVFEALFFNYDFSKEGTTILGRDNNSDIFEKLDKSDPALLERFEFFKKEKKAELKPV